MTEPKFTVGRTVYRIRTSTGATYLCPVRVVRRTPSQIIVETPQGRQERYWTQSLALVGQHSKRGVHAPRSYIRVKPPLIDTRMKISAEAGDWKPSLMVFHADVTSDGMTVTLHLNDNTERRYSMNTAEGRSAFASFIRSCGIDVLEDVTDLIGLPVVGNEGNRMVKFIDLFAGIGGFRLAMERLGAECVFSSEWDKSACKVYHDNYGEYPYGDITEITHGSSELINTVIPDFDVLCAGFPCQPFSRAGVSARQAIGAVHGFECETQGTLFFDVMRIVAAKRPKILFLENVKNLMSHDKGNTFKVIINSITELGYRPYYKVINANTVVPQSRQRIYIVAVHKSVEGEYEFPSFEGTPLPLRSILDVWPDDRLTISDRLWEGHKNRTSRNIERGAGFTAFTADLDKPSNTIVARYGKDGKECLIPQDGKNPRMLSIRECARLFGYPEDFKVKLPKTRAYERFGNTVVVPVIEKIAANFVPMLNKQ